MGSDELERRIQAQRAARQTTEAEAATRAEEERRRRESANRERQEGSAKADRVIPQVVREVVDTLNRHSTGGTWQARQVEGVQHRVHYWNGGDGEQEDIHYDVGYRGAMLSRTLPDGAVERMFIGNRGSDVTVSYGKDQNGFQSSHTLPSEHMLDYSDGVQTTGKDDASLKDALGSKIADVAIRNLKDISRK